MLNLSDILKGIKNGTYDAGINKEYCFVLDEDGYVVFLKKNLDNPHQKDLNHHGETRNNWPENSYDGEILWRQQTYESRGLDITAQFLDALGIDYQG